MIYFPSVYFNSGSAVVDASNKNRIATIALLLKNNQEIKLDVIGHTDNVGSIKFNKRLGLKRANAVIIYLVLHYNIDPDRLSPKTQGEENPLSSITNLNRGKEEENLVDPFAEINRRVDFEIIY